MCFNLYLAVVTLSVVVSTHVVIEFETDSETASTVDVAAVASDKNGDDLQTCRIHVSG